MTARCTLFSNNVAGRGGAIFNVDAQGSIGTVDARQNEFENNLAQVWGGIYNLGTPLVDATDSWWLPAVGSLYHFVGNAVYRASFNPTVPMRRGFVCPVPPIPLPAWVERMNAVGGYSRRYEGSKASQAQNALNLGLSGDIVVIGYSSGADTAVIFSNQYLMSGAGRIPIW